MTTRTPSRTEPYAKALRRHMTATEAIAADDAIPLLDRAAILRRIGRFCLDVADNIDEAHTDRKYSRATDD